MHSVTQRQLLAFLEAVAPFRPVFIWGPPGVGKSSLVEAFAQAHRLDCVSLLGSQLAPEDLIGVPQIVGGKSRFCPPEMIARDNPYVLFLDELNAASTEVQKAFYSLIHERRIADYRLPPGSMVIGAGNRQQDRAIVRPMASALVNRMLHVELKISADEWLDWAAASRIHPWVQRYIQLAPGQLVDSPPDTETPFSTPRAWHMLSDALIGYGPTITPDEIALVAAACLSAAHAVQFTAFVQQELFAIDPEAILSGAQPLPTERDPLYFLALTLRGYVAERLPTDKKNLKKATRELVRQTFTLIGKLAAIDAELIPIFLEPGAHGTPFPAWFSAEIATSLIRMRAGINADENARPIGLD